MPQAPSFLRAVVPPLVRLGGRRLLPLTLGHAVLLRAIGSPFSPYPTGVSGSEFKVQGPTVGDVALARFILTRPWAEARDTMDGWWQRQRLTLWGLLHSREWMIGALLRHILADAAVPPYRVLGLGPVPEEAGPLGAPTELRLVAFLVSQGYDHELALDTPVALAWWLSLANSEAIGGLRLQPELDPAAPAPVPVPAKEYAPEVMAAWGQSQQARHMAGRAYDPAVDSLEAFALQLETRNSELGTADTGGAA
jgi:hypothetical protein